MKNSKSCSSVGTLYNLSAIRMTEYNVSKFLNSTKISRCVSVAFPITMMITGMVGNSLALLLVYRSYRNKADKRKRSFLLCIGSLALTDLSGQLLTSPIVISVYWADLEWERIDPSGGLCAFFGVCMTMFGLCPLFLASSMAIERTLAITCPLWYANHMKTSITKSALALISCLVLLFALLPIAGVGKYELQWPGTWCFIDTGDRDTLGNVFFSTTFAVLGIFSLLVTVFCNAITIRFLLTRCRTKPGSSQTAKQWEKLTMETVIQLMGIMCVLVICWSPLLILMLKMILTQRSSHLCKTNVVPSSCGQDPKVDCNFFLTAIRMASLNQILDPWVYLLLREILLRKFCQMATAVSNFSKEGHKEPAGTLDALNKPAIDNDITEKQ
ncbi:prostaglandin E2 receptor EP3 subtype [Paramormyrops kingsleyae]|uniref:Prostaglandin E2 receptor EP3 subtype n=1 Tax=Paramormyrops kingsleyae TaxID=1676925 RepID=A0A3B3QGL9_9TELE|nr:prostaglandin E2 receptor EP3 subtype [Paramormyrops kingsleyae]